MADKTVKTDKTDSQYSSTTTITTTTGTNFNAAFEILSKYCNASDDDTEYTPGIVEIVIDPAGVSEDDRILLEIYGFHADEEDSSFYTFMNPHNTGADNEDDPSGTGPSGTADTPVANPVIGVNAVVTLTQQCRTRLSSFNVSTYGEQFYVYMGMIPNKPGCCLLIGSTGCVYTDFRMFDIELTAGIAR